MFICSEALNCIRKDCPHAIPHEKRDDCGEANCFGKLVDCIPFKKDEKNIDNLSKMIKI